MVHSVTEIQSEFGRWNEKASEHTNFGNRVQWNLEQLYWIREPELELRSSANRAALDADVFISEIRNQFPNNFQMISE